MNLRVWDNNFGTGRVLAVILGCIVASLLDDKIAALITNDTGVIFFENPLGVNQFACWLLIFVSVTILVGQPKHDFIEKICYLGSGLATSILYIQYCISVGGMKLCVIFTIFFVFVILYINGLLLKRENRYNSERAKFYQNIMACMIMWVLGFIPYGIFSLWLGFSANFWLGCTLMFIGMINIGLSLMAMRVQK